MSSLLRHSRKTELEADSCHAAVYEVGSAPLTILCFLLEDKARNKPRMAGTVIQALLAVLCMVVLVRGDATPSLPTCAVSLFDDYSFKQAWLQ